MEVEDALGPPGKGPEAALTVGDGQAGVKVGGRIQNLLPYPAVEGGVPSIAFAWSF